MTAGRGGAVSDMTDSTAAAWEVAAHVLDPELPVLSLTDLGVLRDIEVVDSPAGPRVRVTITPTYSGCPAMATMRADLEYALVAAGYADVEVRTQLAPAWSSDWISASGRRKLLAAGISPPSSAPKRSPTGTPIPLTLLAPSREAACPQCGSAETEETSHFGSTACMAMYRCKACAEPFPHVKELR